MSSAGAAMRDDDWLADLGYPFYRRLFNPEGDFVTNQRQTLAKARISDPVDLYLSRAITIGLFTGLLLWITGTLLGWALFAFGIVPDAILGLQLYDPTIVAVINAVKVPAAILLIGIVFGWIGFLLGFGFMVVLPYSRASARKREINLLLPDAVSFMYALSVGGLNQLEILEAMARADDTYGEVSREFKTIIQETEYFDTDYRSAIRQQSLETPSEELSLFLTDMLSIINSGGDMESFLDDKKDKHMRTAKQEQETILETLELFGEMYMTLSLFPLLLIIILVIMSMLGQADQTLLFGIVYGLIPLTGAGFLVLISTVKQDDPGDGYLRFKGEERGGGDGNGLLSAGIIDRYVGEWAVFKRIQRRELSHRIRGILTAPHLFFRDNPLYSLGLTVPLTTVVLAAAFVQGLAPTSYDAMVENPVGSTFVLVYAPAYIVLFPLTAFYEWNIYTRKGVINSLSDNLRKLSSANDTGLTLLESIRTVADTSTGSLAQELDIIYSKVQYGTSLRAALIEFNNKYHIPRLSRTVTLISKAQEASSQITEVLSTAAQASENQDDIDRDRKSRTRMQVVIILMTYFTLLAVMAVLKTQFLDVMAGLTEEAGSGGGGGGSLGGGLDTQLLSLLFFHAVTAQAVLSGLISGYIRDASLMSGIKFVVVLLTVALATWIMVG
ncbi:MAG: type II secretion system F family protein [Halobacteriales archaeon]